MALGAAGRLGWALGALGSVATAACTVTGTVGIEPRGTGGAGGGSSTAGTGGGSTTPLTVDKIDIVLAIDNSRAMADKQQILALALADLMKALVDPPCVDGTGAVVSAQPASESDACPPGTMRQFAPVTDIHIGVITSSIGGHGADICRGVDTSTCPGGAVNGSENDHGRLVTRTDPCGGVVVPTYESEGFLAWDPGGVDSPPGQAQLTTLTIDMQALTAGAGEIGCHYASQLESWYRFLVEPDPYASIDVVDLPCLASKQACPDTSAVQLDIDAALLAQRQDFLRPDSLLAILMLSDQNDCSIQDSGRGYLAAQITDPAEPGQPFYLPQPRSECAASPADPCCRPCNADQTGCPPDPMCATSPTLDAESDDPNLRCWDEKRRFGVDFLYGTGRYVTGLTAAMVPNREGELVPNPIFENLAAGGGALVRDPSLVILAGIVGVPWQDVARDPTDLRKGFKNAAELTTPIAGGGATTWDVILGDPTVYQPAIDPHMIEATAPRAGTDPITQTTMAPATAPSGTDPISGHEFTQGTPADLEYACIFTLPKARDCTDTSLTSCDCQDPANDNPLCEPDPNKNGQRTLQVRAKAYPGLRQLTVLRDLGLQGVVASICPAQQTDASQADFGYRPAIQALVDRVSARLGSL